MFRPTAALIAGLAALPIAFAAPADGELPPLR